MAFALLAAAVRALLFTWAWRLYALAVRVRHQPVSTVRAMAMGPVALEGELQPAGSYLSHPVTGEPCLYYVGADSEHPDARFYLVDDSGRVLIDPQKACSRCTARRGMERRFRNCRTGSHRSRYVCDPGKCPASGEARERLYSRSLVSLAHYKVLLAMPGLRIAISAVAALTANWSFLFRPKALQAFSLR